MFSQQFNQLGICCAIHWLSAEIYCKFMVALFNQRTFFRIGFNEDLVNHFILNYLCAAGGWAKCVPTQVGRAKLTVSGLLMTSIFGVLFGIRPGTQGVVTGEAWRFGFAIVSTIEVWLEVAVAGSSTRCPPKIIRSDGKISSSKTWNNRCRPIKATPTRPTFLA